MVYSLAQTVEDRAKASPNKCLLILKFIKWKRDLPYEKRQKTDALSTVT